MSLPPSDLTPAVPSVALPPAGSVLGVDVGFSPTRKSSAVCRLDWGQNSVSWAIQRFRANPDEQVAAITAIAGAGPLLAAAFDGPLRAGFEVIGRYRTAERMLTRRLAKRIGKPGQASAPVGKSLNAAANDCASIVMKNCQLGASKHRVKIDSLAIVEAFPSSFLGVMLSDALQVVAKRGDRSDLFFKHLFSNGEIERLIVHLLPGRRLDADLSQITNHDDRAGFVCALTALAVAAEDYTAVGDDDGWIILPPAEFIQRWAWNDLEANAQAEQVGCLYRSRDITA